MHGAEGEVGLTERERAILAFEHRQFIRQGAKVQAIKDEFDLSATRYYQLLRAVAQKPDALVADPVLVNRIRRRLRLSA